LGEQLAIVHGALRDYGGVLMDKVMVGFFG